MAETLISLMNTVVGYLVGPVKRGARYLLCLNQLMEDARKAKEDLETKLADVRKSEKEVTNQAEELMPSVEKWLTDVEKILGEVERLQQKFEGGSGKNCLNMSHRYSLARNMEEKVKQMRQLESRHFDKFSTRAQLLVSFVTPKDFVFFPTRQSTFNSLLKAIKDEKNQMVGLYGMGGTGKTDLAKRVGSKVAEQKLFGKVVFVTVSQNIDVVKIRTEIAEQIGLKFQQDESPLGRLQRLQLRLQNMKILLILDDVWRTLDLQKEIEISLNEGSRVLLITRLRSVCNMMNCNSIELPLLTKDEAWVLFKTRAGMPDEFEKVARQIADECEGLPIAIVVVGTFLKGKSKGTWRWALSKLQRSQLLDNENGLGGPYKCLRLSYEGLQRQRDKSLFLLCSMFPEDHEIHKEDLVRFSKGTIEPVMKSTMEQARLEIFAAIETLLDSCLLMPTNNQACVKMHDLIRDVALWIAKDERREVLVESREVLNMLAESEKAQDAKVMSLWNLGKNFKIPEQLRCPTPEILLLHPAERTDNFEGIVDNFEGIEALKVLAFVRFSFDWILPWRSTKWSMPQSILSSKNLHTLCLRGITLGDGSLLDKFDGLEILDLRGSSLHELPVGIGDMKKLKLLDLFGCSIKKSPYEAIGKCKQLEELHLWNKKHAIPQTFSVSRLHRYVICDSTWDFGRQNVPVISVDISWRCSFLQYFAGCVEELRALCIQGCNIAELLPSMIDLIHRAEMLYLENCGWESIKEVKSEIKRLVLVRCPGKRLIFDDLDVNNPQGQEVFRHLITLRLADMVNLERVFQDSSINCSLETLEEVNVQRCTKLRGLCFPKSSKLRCLRELQLAYCPMLELPIFTTSMVQSLVGLEKLYLKNCNNLKHIIAEGEEEWKVYGNSNSGAFQNLRTLEVDSCETLESLLPLYCARNLGRLEYLSVQSTPKLNYVVGRTKDDRSSVLQKIENKNPIEIEVNMPSLTDVQFAELPGLISLFPQHCSPSKTLQRTQNDRVWMVITAIFNQGRDPVLPQSLQVFSNLKTLSVKSCMRNEAIFEFLVEHGQKPFKLDSALSSIEVINLPELEFIWKGPTQILSLHKLEHVQLWNCPKLRTIFTLATITNLPELRELYVIKCEEWEGIFSEDSLKTLPGPSHNVCFPKLSAIFIQSCNKVKWVFSYPLACHCPSLETLQIWDCSELERVVYGFEGEASVNQPLFPELKSKLSLLKLPNLKEIFRGFEYQPHHNIQDCPNLSYLFADNLK